MSFRGRLTLFFLLIVVLPMVVIAVLAARTADDASTGKADARLFGGLETATALYEEQTRQAEQAAEKIAADPALGAAIRSGDAARTQQLATTLAEAHGVEVLRLTSTDGQELASVGAGEPFAAAQLALDDGAREVGELTVSLVPAPSFLEEVERLTGRRAALYEEGQDSVTLNGEEVTVPGSGASDVTMANQEQRVLTGALPDADRRIALFGPPEDTGFFASSPTVIAILACVAAVALLFVLYLRRHLSRQVAVMLAAAKRIGSGDFSEKVPVMGGRRDEMAGLAVEFNRMSDRLSEQMDQVRRQQLDIDRSVRRIGEAFAGGLDREVLLGIVTETAVSACNAEYGVLALSGREGAEVSSGVGTDALQDAVLSAEEQADRAGEAVARDRAGVHALSAPLRTIGDPGSLGVMSVARNGEPFSGPERDVFLYLIGQASASIENLALHDLVSEQAVTDDLTGLANKRAFRDVANKEAARAERFGHALSLLMLDIDDFKQVNDTHGHLQGDEVLRRVGRILEEESRGIDEPARYGGEEFAIALPETNSQGAAEVAERVRERIETEDVPFVEREGRMQVTASIGVATMPEAARDVRTLIAAADAALYAAKRGGKNRVVSAPAVAAGEGRRPAGIRDV